MNNEEKIIELLQFITETLQAHGAKLDDITETLQTHGEKLDEFQTCIDTLLEWADDAQVVVKVPFAKNSVPEKIAN